MILRSTLWAALLFGATCGLGAAPILAQAGAAPTGKPPHVAKRSAHKIRPIKAPAKPVAKELEPWAAVDPGRAGAARPADPGAAAVPGVRHVIQPDEDSMSYGMKWNSSNAPNAGPDSTQGVLNEVNHDLGAPNSVGTDAEVGARLKF